ILPEKRYAAHDHSGRAVGALKSLGVEKSLLNRVEAAGLFEAFDGDDGFSSRCRDRRNARTSRRAVEQNRARAALAFAAAVFAAGQAEMVAENGQKRCFGT